MIIWRDIKGYEGYYQVSSEGIFKSIRSNRILKPCANKYGYYHVQLCGKTCDIAPIVAHTFPEICGEYFEGANVNHLDEDKSNNAASNLRWVDRRTNNCWGTRLQRCSKAMTNGKNSKQIAQYTLDGEFVRLWASAREIQRQTGYWDTSITKCCRGEVNKSHNYIWKYA